jgi:hypothetical protein
MRMRMGVVRRGRCRDSSNHVPAEVIICALLSEDLALKKYPCKVDRVIHIYKIKEISSD